MTQLPCRRNGPGEMKIFYLAGSQWICVQLTQPLAIARRPCRNMTSKVRSEDAFAVLTKGRAERQFIVEFEFLCLAAVHIPQNDIVVASTSYEPPIAEVANPERAFVVGRPILRLFAFLHFPKLRGAIFAA